jgi:hypothetical protein
MENANLETIAAENEPAQIVNERTNSYRETIETVITSLEQNESAMVLHTENIYFWKFQYGTVEVFVQLTGENDEDLLTVWSPIVKLPARDELGLMRKILEMNWTDTLETCFAINNDNNEVVLVCQRTVADLSPVEISRAITLVATIADENNQALRRYL